MFRVLPEEFFVPLGSPNKIVYWECIRKLFTVMSNQLSFGVERDVLTDELEYYFNQANAAGIDDEEIKNADSRTKANWMLRRLEHYGWIEIETDKSYIQRVNFKEYAVKFIKTMLEIADGGQIEYQGYIYTIYSLVKNGTDNPGIVLLQIVENTDKLITALKNLNSNIKHYIDDLTKHRTVAEIMDALFNDYITNIVDKAYHRLRTSENVSKFRPEIVSLMNQRSRDAVYVQNAGRDIAGIQEISQEEAEELVYTYIRQVLDAFENMDDILLEIDRKNTAYQKAAINRAKFLLTGNDDVRGQLKELLLELGERMDEEGMAPSGIYRIDFMDDLVRLYVSALIDEKSLYMPVEGRKEFRPSVLADAKADEEWRLAKLARLRAKLDRVLSPQKIENYVSECMENRRDMRASELPLDSAEKFVKLIYIRLYGQRRNVNYSVEPGTMQSVNGYRFRDYTIRKK